MTRAGLPRSAVNGLCRLTAAIVCALSAVGIHRAQATEYSPFNLAGFDTNASLGLGGIFRDNLLFAPIARTPAFGTEISPTISATRSGSIGTTSIFGSIDTGIFPGHSSGDYSQYDASISHVYSPRRDLTFTGGFSFNYSNGNANNSGTSINLSNYTTSSFGVNGSVEKDFGRIADILSTSFTSTDVPNNSNTSTIVGLSPLTTLNPTSNAASTTPSLFAALPQGTTQTFTVSNQTTYNLTPLITPRVSEDFQKSSGAYDQTSFGGHVGLGIGRIGLFTSSVDAGAEVQSSSSFSSANANSSSNTSTYQAGFSTTYDFRRYLIFTFSANVSYGALTLPTVGAAFAQNNAQTVGGATPSGAVSSAGAGRVLSSDNTLQKNFSATAVYTLFSRASLNAALAYNDISQQGTPTTVFTAQTGLSYSISASNDLTFSYQYTRATGLAALSSVIVIASSAQNLPIEVNTVRLGVRHRF